MGTEASMWSMLRINVFLLLLISCWLCSVSASVSYDHKAIIVNGKRRILLSGSIHYPRSTPEMWPDLIQKAKDGGLDVIQTYVFWNGHEPYPGKYYFEDRYDLVKFIKLVQQAGLYVHLRIGPYVCAEWNFGGFPVWLKYVPGIEFRTDNEPFKAAMQRFTWHIANIMKAERLFEPQGGPIILSQIENEFGPVEWQIGAPGKAYTTWAAQMAVSLNTGVPWVMCKQEDAPGPVINACNGFYCDGVKPNSRNKPKMWTENWTGWFTGFGQPVPYRPSEDLAFSVAKFIQNGGSFVNYYMYHGGTNFGRTAGGPFISTSYDYDAPIDEFGLTKDPKWGHLRDLHRAIKLCEPALVSADPTVIKYGYQQEAHVYKAPGACAAFLANYDPKSYAEVTYGNMKYNLPPWSISILPDCRNEIFNTARLGAQSSQKWMMPTHTAFSWQSFIEESASANDKDTIAANGMLEQVNVTRDSTDYLWYMTEVFISPSEMFLETGKYPLLTIWSAGHALHVFINGQHSGTAYGSIENPKLTFSNYVNLRAGVNKISILSVAVGLPNVGLHFERWNAGVLGPVWLKGLNEGTRELSKQKWFYKIGLKGEALSVHTLGGSSSIEWVEGSLLSYKQALTWYKATFNAPAGNDPLALDMSTMGKGEIWINGRSIGRHWPAYTATGHCVDCNYAGPYSENKCRGGCGEPSQKWYHVPRSWLKPADNLLVVFEELGGDPSGIDLLKRVVHSVCADIYDGQPAMQIGSRHPKAHLWCPPGKKISKIEFASYGTPKGRCGWYSEGSCHAHKSYDAFVKDCIGIQFCSVNVAPKVFGGDPCPAIKEKKLSVEAICS